MKSKLILIGIVLLLCLPAFVVIAGVGAYFAPRQYFSKCTVEFRGIDHAEFVQAFQLAARPYEKSATLQEVRNTGLYGIGIYDADPQQAANKANGIAVILQGKFNAAALPPPKSTGNPTVESREEAALAEVQARMDAKLRRPAVLIWEKAEAAAVPARPNVPFIMFIAITGGMVFAAFGVIVLIVGLISRAGQVPPLRRAV